MLETEADIEVLRYYICPICRYTFKCSYDLDASGVVCPGCDHLIRVHRAAASSASSSIQMTREFDELKIPRWEKKKEALISKKIGFIGKIATTSVILGTTLVTARAGWKAVENLNQDLVENADMTGEQLLSKQDELLKDAETVIGKLLGSASSEVAKKYFYLDEAVETEYDAFYKKEKWARVGNFEAKGKVLDDAKLVKFEFTTPAGVPPIFVGISAEEMKVDWPSFVGYSETSPKSLLIADPLKKGKFRVKIAASRNYDFSQTEEEWYVVAIKFPSLDETFYGYVKLSNTELVYKLKDLTVNDQPLVILELQPIKGEDGLNKFIITRVVSDDWIER